MSSSPPNPAEVTLVIDGAAQTFTMPDDSGSLLEAALEAGLEPPFACMEGICGSCRGRLVEGDVTMADAFAVTDEDRAAGLVLLCRSRPAAARIVIELEGT